MPKPSYLSVAICLALNSTAFSIIANELDERSVEVIEVTANKRVQNIQKVAVAVSALSGNDIANLNIGSMDDFSLYMPNVNLGGRGPGQAEIFIRGMAIQPINVMLSGAQGTTPNVALYLDEQPVTAPGRNLDVYPADLARIEVLAGPQGTLFGASSQAGTIRYITNKPDLDTFSFTASSAIESVQHGDMGSRIESAINLPITDKFAARLTTYSVQQAGYIDNVAGEFTLDPNINPDSAVGLTGATYDFARNDALVKDDFNDSSYQGFRLAGHYQITNEWSLLLQHSQQRIEADGVFDYDPELDDLEVQRYFPDELEDEFAQTAWTLSGEFADLAVVYTGAFLDREIQQSIDYTGYNNTGAYIAYYTCTYDNPDYIVNYDINPELITQPRHCTDPTKGFKGFQEHERLTHEFRISSDESYTLSFVTGVFIDDFEIKTQDDYYYLTAPALGFAPNAPIPTANNINPNVRPDSVTFFNDVTRQEEQIAVFGELAYRLTDRLTATLGLRWYEIESDLSGSTNFADGIFQGSVNTDRGRDYDVSGGHTKKPLKQDDVIPKFNLSYQWNNDILVYGTYSEGFRPGGFNRGGGIPSANPAFPDVKTTYDTDDVINYELGWKTLLYDNNVRLNGSLYYIEWNDMQVSRFDPANVSILTFIENAADSEIKGLELDVAWQVNENLSLTSAMSFNDTELTRLKAQVIEMAPVGSELPITPEIKANIHLRYDWQLAEYQANWQFAWLYSGEAWSSIVAAQRERQDDYQIINLSFGIEKDNWQVKLYADNISDERAELFINDQDDVKRVTTNQPRTYGIQLSYFY